MIILLFMVAILKKKTVFIKGEMNMLQENYKTVQQKIRNACNRCGREYSEVTLIVVGKTQSVEMLQKIYDLNHRDFGENKVQELM